MPNSSKKTKVKSIRIENNVASWIEKDKKNALNRVVESLYREVMRGNLELRSSEVILPKGVDRKGFRVIELEEKVYRSLEDTLYIDDMSVSAFMKEVVEAVDKGMIWIEKGKLVVQNSQKG